MRRFIQLAALLAVAATLTGCGRNEAAPAAPPAPQVNVASVVEKDITEFDEFTGRFEAVERVEIRPRVAGYIASVNFDEGRPVRKGEVLFVIDPRPYEAELKRTEAEVARARTQATLALSERDRATKLLDSRAISREEFDTRVSGSEQAGANLAAAEAARDVAKLNLTFTRVTSPINGVVGRAEITTGNLVGSGEPRLTTVVSVDPIYVAFDGDEQVFLKYNELARRGERSNSRDAQHPIWAGLANEEGHPHAGVMVFLDNALDPETGTIRARGRFDNHDNRFTPGMFARVKLSGSGRYNALLINDSAIGTDQNNRFVYVVGKDNKIEYRRVKLGPIVDGLRVVRDGLKPGETIVVNGLQRVRPGVEVAPQRVAMNETAARDQNLVAQNDEKTQ